MRYEEAYGRLESPTQQLPNGKSGSLDGSDQEGL